MIIERTSSPWLQDLSRSELNRLGIMESIKIGMLPLMTSETKFKNCLLKFISKILKFRLFKWNFN
jgi:hypothetical protein